MFESDNNPTKGQNQHTSENWTQPCKSKIFMLTNYIYIQNSNVYSYDNIKNKSEFCVLKTTITEWKKEQFIEMSALGNV